jgi:hypothetical protein
MKFIQFEVIPIGQLGDFRLIALTDTGEIYTKLYVENEIQGEWKLIDEGKPKSYWRQ